MNDDSIPDAIREGQTDGAFRQYMRGLRGAITFLTRLSVLSRKESTHAAADWEAFRSRPATFPLVGWLVGSLAALVFLASSVLPNTTVALGYVLAIYLLTGIHHLDGVADLGDALVVHGDRERRLEVLKDTTTGVGALLAVALVVGGLGLGALELAALPIAVAVGTVVAAEVGAKTGMAAMACLSSAAHEGLGSQLTTAVGPAALVFPLAIALPAVALTWPHPAAAATVVGALVGTTLPWLWAHRNIGGVTGDIFGAANEISRVVGLHTGVIAWTLW